MLPARNLVPLAQLVQSEMTNTKTDEGPVVYTVPEVAAILKVCEKSVYRLIERNILKSCCALRHKRISRMDLERFVHASSGMYQ